MNAVLKIIVLVALVPFYPSAQVFNTAVPNSADVLARSIQADKLVKAGQYEEALNQYDNILESAPDYVDGYMRRAVLLSRLGRLPEAIQDYNTAKQLDPYVVEVFDIYGRINKMKVLKGVNINQIEDAPMALREIEIQLKKDNNNPLLLFAGANLKVLMGNYRDAIEDFTRATTLKPDYSEAIYNRGIVYVIINNKVRACEDFYLSSQLGSERAARKYAFFCKK